MTVPFSLSLTASFGFIIENNITTTGVRGEACLEAASGQPVLEYHLAQQQKRGLQHTQHIMLYPLRHAIHPLVAFSVEEDLKSSPPNPILASSCVYDKGAQTSSS